jgi:hypothetical protein
MDFTRRKKWIYRTGGAMAVVAGLALGGGAVVGATTTSQPASQHTTSQQTGGGGHGPPAPLGTVSAVTSTTLTITDPKGTSHTIGLTGSTTYTKDGKSASASDLTAGEYVVIQPARPSTPPAQGQKPSGPMVATAVHIVASLPAPPQGQGQGGPSGQNGSSQGAPPRGAPIDSAA